jgi:hypothetical protein
LTFEIYIARQGCGMGFCAILEVYANCPEFVLERASDLPEDCRECVRLNEEERSKDDERGTTPEDDGGQVFA